MSLTKQYLRRMVAQNAGDMIILTTSADGATDGSTAVLASLDTTEDDAYFGHWLVAQLGYSVGIAGYTEASPTVVTTTAAHNLYVGAKVTISGSTHGLTTIDGSWIVSSIPTSMTFTCYNMNNTSSPEGAGGTITSDGNLQYTLFARITSSSGPPAPSNPTHYTMTLVPPLGQQITAGTTVEIMAYRPDWYTTAVNTAAQNIFPWLYKVLYDGSLNNLQQSVFNYPMPNGTFTVSVGAFPSGATPLITTPTPHFQQVGNLVTITGCPVSGMNVTSAAVLSVPSIYTLTVAGTTASTAGSGGTLTAPGNTVDVSDVTRVMMTGQVNTPFQDQPKYEIADYSVLTNGPNGEAELVINRQGAPYQVIPVPGRSIILMGWQHLSGVLPDTTMFTIQGDLNTNPAPELDPGSEYDILFREWVMAYLYRTLMSAPATPNRDAFTNMFNTQMQYALQQATQHKMRIPERTAVL